MSERIDPFETMDRLFEQMRQGVLGGFDQSPGDWNGDGAGWNRPALTADSTMRSHAPTVEESDDGYVVIADLPGFETDELDVTFTDGTLTINGTHEVTDGATSRNRTVRESVRVPGDVVVDEVTAAYQNGVLEIRLPVEDSGDSVHIDVE